MIVLGIEASTEAGGVALIDDDALVGERHTSSAKTHSERLLKDIDDVLRSAGIEAGALDGIAVGIGPGSFTGLRIALSTAKGLAFGLGIPIFGVGDLAALAGNVPFWPGRICPMIDARRERVYCGIYKNAGDGQVESVLEDDLRGLEDILGLVREQTVFVGNGARIHRDRIMDKVNNFAYFAPTELMYPRAAVVAGMGLSKLKSGERDNLDALKPFYVQASEAERKLRASLVR